MADRISQVAIGTKFGGYDIMGVLGQGGMGVVYLAWDPKLRRKVALKLLRAGDGSFGEEATRVNGASGDRDTIAASGPSSNMLLDEARSMAKLSHPNVVAVYQVGEVDRQVFIAMEYIEGTTLNQWVSRENPSARAIIDVMIKAGRGLQAAHEAGLVHRDFKADNILLGVDGRVCVTDFGLAQSKADKAASLDHARGNDSFTQRAVGTPEYMAPEQHLRRSADARSDQFAYCVTLFRAVLGIWPFNGETYQDYADNAIAGRVNQPKIKRSERWLKPILMHGLAVDPDKRYPSMGALLAELDRKPKLVRNLVIAGGVTVVASAAVIVAVMSRQHQVAQCVGSETHLAEAWNPAVAEKVKASMLATGVSYATSTARGVTAMLDDYARQWALMHRSTCEATNRGEQSSKLLDLRMACLDRKKGEFGIVINLVGKVDKSTIQSALDAVHSLSPVSDCARSEQLMNVIAEPTDPEKLKTLRRLQQALDGAKAELNSGHYPQSVAALSAIAKDVETIDYAPLLAEALLLRGRNEWHMGELPKSETTLMESIAASERGRDDDKRLMALSELTYVVGYEAGRVPAGLAWAKIAEATLGRVSSHEDFQAELTKSRATVEFRGGLYDDALRHAKESCDILRRTLGDKHRDVAQCLSRIGVVLLRLGRNEEALQYQNQALPIAEAALGSDHPSLGDYLSNSGNCYVSLGDWERALSMHSRALELYRNSLGPEHSMVAVALSNLGSLAFARADYEGARKYFTDAVAIEEKTLGPKHQSAAETLMNLGDTYLALGNAKDAVAPLQRAWSVYADSPAKPPESALVAFSLGRALWESGTQDQALVMVRKALELSGSAEGEDWKTLHDTIDKWLAEHAQP